MNLLGGLIKTGADTEDGGVPMPPEDIGAGGIAPWYRQDTVRRWVGENAAQACKLWRDDAQWRSWLASDAGDRELASKMPAACAKQGFGEFAKTCKIAVKGDFLIALCRSVGPNGGPVTLTATVNLAPVRDALATKVAADAVPAAAVKVSAVRAVQKLAAAKKAAPPPAQGVIRWTPSMAKKVKPFVGAVPIAGPAADRVLAADRRAAPIAAKMSPKVHVALNVAAGGSGTPAQIKAMRGKITAMRKAGPSPAVQQLKVLNLHRQADAIRAARATPKGQAIVRAHAQASARGSARVGGRIGARAGDRSRIGGVALVGVGGWVKSAVGKVFRTGAGTGAWFSQAAA